jgi:hypothetical protein
MLGPNAGAEELAIQWKDGKGRRALPPRARSLARAQLRDDDPLRSL